MGTSSATGKVTLTNDVQFNGVRVFSATMMAEREQLGERVTDWLRQHPEVKPVDVVVTQSSDQQFHCVAITVFYRTP
ncbi:MAG: hypothetical protein IPL79_19425 [Myxococcales bacterium]|nr:hypothetical protein [Myxococcales bacterium]